MSTHYRLIRLDRPREIAPDDRATTTDMNIAFTDPDRYDTGRNPTLYVVKTLEQYIGGERRRVYAALAPLRLIVVLRGCGELDRIPSGSYLKALVGNDPGTSKYALSFAAGQVHTKITVDGIYSPGDVRQPRPYWNGSYIEHDDITDLEQIAFSDLLKQVPAIGQEQSA